MSLSMTTFDRSTGSSHSKLPDLDTEAQIAPAAKLMASIGRLSGFLDKIEQAQAKGQSPGAQLFGATMDTQHCEASRDPVRLLMVSAASSIDEFLTEIRPLLEGAHFDKGELVFVIPPELDDHLIEPMGRFIARRVFVESLSSSAAAELRANPDNPAQWSRAGSALNRELAMVQAFYQPLGVNSPARLHEAYALYLDAVGPPRKGK
jgi:hypothetical protein